ncbi:MAG: gamma-glutamyltransferase [Rhodobacteraceae bacterium]|nr:gamma-glutamyltransferase [Paracoccaceae bacterium]
MSLPSLPFTCEKQPASGAGGIVVTNNPLGSMAGQQVLAAGGNAIDAAVASLFALSVVEPMMVGIAGGGLSHIRLADGRHVVIDALASAGSAMRPDIYEPLDDPNATFLISKDRVNLVGPSAVAVPGNLAGWHHMQTTYGRLPFEDVVEPARHYAARGFAATQYLTGAIKMELDDLSNDPETAATLLVDGNVPEVGHKIVMSNYADSLALIQKQGASALYGGALGTALIDSMSRSDKYAGWLTMEDLRSYRPKEREAVFGTYRGHDIVGPPPPASSGVHIVQMLNMLEAFDIKSMGFGSADLLHLLATVTSKAFEDRRQASGDPDFVPVPVEKFTSKDYARQCIAGLDGLKAMPAAPYESADTTHVTVADKDGNVVSATHTINGLFGARYMVPGTGILPNNYMCNFDPNPDRALSIAPGKRVPTSMAPMMVLKDGAPKYALGLPGGVRIFPSAMQAISNLIDHGMSLQEAVEAPRLWTQGGPVELEPAYANQQQAMEQRGHDVVLPNLIGGGMNAIAFEDGGKISGAACWRADGTVAALGGGLARPGVRFEL